MSEEYHFNEDGSFYVPSPELNISADGEDLPDIHGTWYVDNGAIYVEFNDRKIKNTYDADNDLLMDEYGTSLSRVN